MAPEPPNQRTQEQSIRARKHELFDEDELPGSTLGPRKSFADCLRETPAAPLSTMVKGLLWAVGVVVLLLLAIALATGGGKKPTRAKTSDTPVASTRV